MPLGESGQELGRWRLEQKLGEGGNGEVWQARGEDEQIAALKILRDARPTHVSFARFAREVEVVHGLGDHRGVLPILDRHLPENPGRRERVWYAMPVAQPLAERLAERAVEEVVAAVADLGRVLAALARDHGIAHRDLKPDNLFWWRDAPSVGDFGLVHLPDATSLTEPGRVPGSFGYIADEAMQGAEDIDWGLADTFSLAKVLWVLLVPSSRFPPQGVLTADGGPASLERALTTPRAGELDRILEAATRHRRERISMDAFVAELDAWLSEPPRPVDDDLEAVVVRARESMAETLSSRDSARRRGEDAGRSFERLRQTALPIEEVLRRIDPSCEVGPHAIGQLNQLIEQGEYVGGPSLESTHHHGVRISKGESGFDLILVVAFCLQVDEDGTGYLGGMVMTGYEEIVGPGVQHHLDSREAPVGSVQLDRHIEEMVAEARERLPEAIEGFSD